MESFAFAKEWAHSHEESLSALRPIKYNGVQLKRINAAYVLSTNTKLKVNAEIAKDINDE